MMKITPVILCGGAGTRLFPLSRESFPKQFMPLLGDISTFEDALMRVSDANLFNPPLIMTAEGFRFIIADILTRYNMQGRIVLEPCRRDSGAAIAAAAALIKDGVMLVLAADHAVKEHDLFTNTVKTALPAAQEGAIVTFGIIPTEPSSAYGYIQAHKGEGVLKVLRFVEKPTKELAKDYIEQGYFWNSGNFMMRSDVFLSELEQFEPAMAKAAKLAANVTLDTTNNGTVFERLEAKSFASSPAKSVDYAVMERTKHACVIAAPYKWSDLGTISALHDMGEKDANNNVLRGDIYTAHTKNSYIDSRKPFTAVIGMENIAVIAMEDALIVAPLDATNDIKDLVNHLKSIQSPLANEHNLVYRPWGWYHSIERGENFQVKRISVNPKARLSLQSHKFRQENWICIKGVATVEVDGVKTDLKVNESIFVPLGAVHRLSNNTSESVEIIEVQNGSYLGEDDIVRFEDDYSRV